ncbi:MAG: nuclease A inhibitor family protein [Cyanobacteria bacterium P01_D01_bin.50]
MTLNTLQLISELEVATEGITYDDDIFRVLLWQVNKKGEFSIFKLLQSEGFIEFVDVNDFLDFVTDENNWDNHDFMSLRSEFDSPSEAAKQYSKQFCNLFKIINLKAQNLQIYRANVPCWYSSKKTRKPEQEAFHIIIFESFDGDWIGIAPKMQFEPNEGRIQRDKKIKIKQNHVIKANSLNIIKRLVKILSNIEFSVIEYTASYREKKFVLEFGNTKESLIANLLESIGFVQIYDFERFSQPGEEWENVLSEEGEYFRNFYRRFQEIDKLLQENLTNLREYAIGLDAVIYFYDIGKTQDDNWVGVWTTNRR